MTDRRRRWPWLALGGVVLIAVLLFAGAGSSSTGGSAGPGGTLALRRLLVAQGVAVRDGDTPPAEGTFVLLRDIRDRTQDATLLRWAADGGRLVVSDPTSDVAAALGIRSERLGGIAGTTSFPPACVAPEVLGVPALVALTSDRVLVNGPVGALRCFPGTGDASFERSIAYGTGRVVLLGGPSPLTNELLATAGNAAFAIGLLGTAGPVVFGPPIGAGGAVAGGVWGAIPTRGKAAILGAAAVLLTYAVVRARRFGRPVEEQIPSPIPAGELTRARADLYRTSGDRAYAGRLLRMWLRERLARRAGLPAATEPDRIAAATAGSGSEDAERLAAVLDGPAPASDEDLMTLGRTVESAGRVRPGG